jgi:phage minor structural protein
MIKKLNGHSLSAAAVFSAESFGLSLEEKGGSANITLAMGEAALSLGDWVQDLDEPGAGIVYRIKTLDTQFDKETVSCSLEHAFNLLKDRIIPGEVTPATIAGSGATSCTAKQAVQYILGLQDDWALGDFDFSVSNPYSFNGETLMAAFETVLGSLDDPLLAFDFSVYPFKVHVREGDSGGLCEMRPGRNLTSLKYTIDRTRMYTRYYPVGKNNKRISGGGYVSKNTDLYGVIEKSETDQSLETEAELIRRANERLKVHAEPAVTGTVSGADLSRSTGESLDQLRIGKKCRMPLTEYNTTIQERITKLQWRDKIKDPEGVTATLANTIADVQSIIRQETEKNSRAGRSAAKENEDFETLVGSVESGLYTRITQTASEIRQEAHNEAEGLRSVISQTAESIRLTVESDVGSLRSQIIQTAESIRLEVASEAASLRSSITQTAESIRLYVGSADAAAEIVAQINASTGESEIKLDAQRVYIGSSKSTTVISGKCSLSDVTANYISGKIAELSVLDVAAISATGNITTSNGVVMAPYLYLGVAGNAKDMASAIQALNISLSGNTYTLQKKDFNDNNWVDVGTFSRATTLSGEWAGGVFSVNASPQSESILTSLTQGAESWSGKTATVPIYATINNGATPVATGKNVTVTYSGVVISDINECYTTAPNGASYDGNTNTSSGYFISGNGRGASCGIVVKCELKQGNTVRKTLYNDLITAPNNLYKKGWDNAADKIDMPSTISGSTTKSSVSVTIPTTSGTTTWTLKLSKDSGGAYLTINGNLKLRVS